MLDDTHWLATSALIDGACGIAGNALLIGEGTTFDIHLNSNAFWCNVPVGVWTYKLGGYQVLKKWLSYRERAILKRPLSDKEVQYFTDTARRIAAIVQLVDT